MKKHGGLSGSKTWRCPTNDLLIALDLQGVSILTLKSGAKFQVSYNFSCDTEFKVTHLFDWIEIDLHGFHRGVITSPVSEEEEKELCKQIAEQIVTRIINKDKVSERAAMTYVEAKGW